MTIENNNNSFKQLNEKIELLYKINILEKEGYNIKNFTIKDDLYMIKYYYQLHSNKFK